MSTSTFIIRPIQFLHGLWPINALRLSQKYNLSSLLTDNYLLIQVYVNGVSLLMRISNLLTMRGIVHAIGSIPDVDLAHCDVLIDDTKMVSALHVHSHAHTHAATQTSSHKYAVYVF